MTGKRRILVVDDDPDFLEFMKIILESKGYGVFVTESAEEGLSLARQIKPDVALVDCMISYVLDGPNVLHTMRSDPELSRIPVVMISAIINADDKSLLSDDERLQCDAFITKPVEPKLLLQKIEELVTRPGVDKD